MNVDVSGSKVLQSPVPMKSNLSVNCNNLQVPLLYLNKQLFKRLIKWLIMHYNEYFEEFIVLSVYEYVFYINLTMIYTYSH